MRKRIGPYRIEKVIGEGNMGQVYKGRHETLGRCAAIKTLLPKNAVDPASRQRLIHEAQAQAHLSHENIVTVYEFIPEDGELFIAMEYVDGETVAALMARSANGRLSYFDALPVILQVLAALEQVHRAKITHRDVKPSNVLVGKGVVKLTDFGIALLPDAPRLTAEQHTIGTVEYMSPEQLEGRAIDHRSDIYSAGVLLYAMLSGHSPFPARDPLAALSQRMAGAPDLCQVLVELPPAISDVLRHALQVRPDDRFPSAAAFRDALRQISAGFIQPIFDSQEDQSTEVQAEAIVTVEAIVAESSPTPIAQWIVIVTSLAAAGYLVSSGRSDVPVAASPSSEASALPQPPQIERIETTSTESPAVDTAIDEPSEPVYTPSTDNTSVDDSVQRELQVAMVRRETQDAITRATEALREERFDDAIAEFESASRGAQTYPGELAPEREAIANLRTQLIEARVAMETRKQQEALWKTRIANVEEDLRRERWPEAERFAKEIFEDATAPPDIVERARALHRQAQEGRISAFQQTHVSPTTNTTVRKPSAPPKKNQ